YPLQAGLAVDLDTDGRIELVTGSAHPSSPLFGLIQILTYDTNLQKFVYKTGTVVPIFFTPGRVSDIRLASLDGDGAFNDFVALGRLYSIIAVNRTNIDFVVTDAFRIAVGDYNSDGLTDVVGVDLAGTVKMYKSAKMLAWSNPTPNLGPFSQISGLEMYQYDAVGDDVALYIRGSRMEVLRGDNGFRIDLWEDPAIYSATLAKMDLNLDGKEDLVVMNYNIIYAFSGGQSTLFPVWSSPLSAYRINAALPIDLDNDGQNELVFSNVRGQLFAVEGIVNPETLARPLIRSTDVTNIDRISWPTSTYTEKDFVTSLDTGLLPKDDAVLIAPEPRIAITIEPWVFLTFGMAMGIASVITRRSFAKTIRNRMKSLEETPNVGGLS
ncbi:MAG TPA: VCBS repeat-containing protein, partial [Candidatus Hodarchaeales archaeon]|nr:VCBS repeat-containing protein [Candidatus Hodarchaeales archaeon]